MTDTKLPEPTHEPNSDNSYVDDEGYRWIAFSWVSPVDGVRRADRMRFDEVIWLSVHMRNPRNPPLIHINGIASDDSIENLRENIN